MSALPDLINSLQSSNNACKRCYLIEEIISAPIDFRDRGNDLQLAFGPGSQGVTSLKLSHSFRAILQQLVKIMATDIMISPNSHCFAWQVLELTSR